MGVCGERMSKEFSRRQNLVGEKGLLSAVQEALRTPMGTGQIVGSPGSGFGEQQLVFSGQVADGFIQGRCPTVQFGHLFVFFPDFQISQTGLEAKDRLILFNLGEFFLQIPYLIFELRDHDSSQPAAPALGRRQISENASTRDWAAATSGRKGRRDRLLTPLFLGHSSGQHVPPLIPLYNLSGFWGNFNRLRQLRATPPSPPISGEKGSNHSVMGEMLRLEVTFQPQIVGNKLCCRLGGQGPSWPLP